MAGLLYPESLKAVMRGNSLIDPFGYAEDLSRRFAKNPNALTALEAIGLPATLAGNVAGNFALEKTGSPLAATIADVGMQTGLLPVAIAKGAPKVGKEIARQYETGEGLIGAMSISPKENIVPNKMSALNIDSPYVEGVKYGDELIVHHNIPQQGLINVNEHGGKLAVPSIAISKASQPLENFGEISLIGSKSMAAPSKSNPVWAFDAYTKRFPRIEMQPTKKGSQIIAEDFAPAYGKFAKSADYELSELAKDLRGRLDTTPGKVQYLYEKGLLPDPNSFEKYTDFRNAANKVYEDVYYSNKKMPSGLSVGDDFAEWSSNKVENFRQSGEFKDVFGAGYNNQGIYKYKPATIENFVKEMKGQAGEESGSFLGLGQMRAKVASKFKSIEDVKKSRNLIVDPEQFAEKKYEIENYHQELVNELADRIGNKSYYANDTANALLEDLYTGRYNPKDEFNKEYASLIDDEFIKKANKVRNELKNFPSEYFEIKPQRAVDISEFEGAIIPKETSQRVRNILKNKGILEVYEYATPEQRKELFKKFGSKMFSGLPAIPVGGGLLDQQQYD
jgi:hypothetical protein